MTMGLCHTSAEEAINNLSEKQLKDNKILGEEQEASKSTKSIGKFRSVKKNYRVGW